MFFYLSKIIYFFLQPTVWVISFLLLGILAKSTKKRKRYLIGSLLVLFIFSNPFLFHEFERAWEVKTNSTPILKDTADVAIILGGMVKFNEQRNMLDFHENADRVLTVLPLYFEGRVRKLLISGGSGSLIQEELEANILSDYLISIGVKSKDILKETKSRNTYENALYSTKLIKENASYQTVLLSTSAMHMKRSLLCFEKQGLAVIPFPVDGAEKRKFYPDELFLPKAEILSNWYHLIHEWIGLISYKVLRYC